VLAIADLDCTHESIQSRRGGFGKSFLQTGRLSRDGVGARGWTFNIKTRTSSVEPRTPAGNRRQMGIRCVDAAGGANQGAGAGGGLCLGEVEPFYGTRVGPGWYQSSAGVTAGLERCEPLAQLLQMLMLHGGPKPPNATSKPPQSLLIANRLRPQSHLKATLKPPQSHLKARGKRGNTVAEDAAHCVRACRIEIAGMIRRERAGLQAGLS